MSFGYEEEIPDSPDGWKQSSDGNLLLAGVLIVTVGIFGAAGAIIIAGSKAERQISTLATRLPFMAS